MEEQSLLEGRALLRGGGIGNDSITASLGMAVPGQPPVPAAEPLSTILSPWGSRRADFTPSLKDGHMNLVTEPYGHRIRWSQNLAMAHWVWFRDGHTT